MSAATTPSPSPSLFAAADVRIDAAGVPVCDGLTVTASGRHVLVLGAPRALFEATCGLRPIVRGSLTVQGTAPAEGVEQGFLAGAPLDPPLPPRWTVTEYVTWSARLAGHDATEAKRLATSAIETMQLVGFAKTTLAAVVPHARRAVVVAAALATAPDVLVMEDPTGGLPEESSRTLAHILVKAVEDRPWIVFAARVPFTSPIALAAQEAIVISSSRVESQGPPAELAAAKRKYVARVQGSVELLGARLAERGGSIEVQGAQVIVDLGESLSTAEVLGLCLESNVLVVEMLPVARALA